MKKVGRICIEKAISNLLLDSPFFGSLILEAELKETEEVPTAAVDGRGKIFVNPRYVERLQVSEVQGLLAHEALHLALLHFVRESGRDKRRWNIAADLAVNSILAEKRFALPPGGIFPRDFGFEDGLSAEEYYRLLEKLPPPPQPPPGGEGEEEGEGGNGGGGRRRSEGFDEHRIPPRAGSGNGGGKEDGSEGGQSGKDPHQKDDSGEGRDVGERHGEGGKKDGGKGGNEHGDGEDGKKDKDRDGVQADNEYEERGLTEEDIRKIEAKWKRAVARAMSIRKRGELPGWFEQMICELFEPKLNWRFILREFIADNCVISGVDWTRRDRRFQDVYLPSRREKVVKFAIAVDTSGSISDKELAAFFSEVNAILGSNGAYDIILIQCDADITSVKEIAYPDTIDWSEIRIVGRGGTDFRPVFRYLEDHNDNRPLVYFTDLEGVFPEATQRKVLWVVVGRKKEVPFGEVVELEVES
jgi:predicted metal-dependent peptidase